MLSVVGPVWPPVYVTRRVRLAVRVAEGRGVPAKLGKRLWRARAGEHRPTVAREALAQPLATQTSNLAAKQERRTRLLAELAGSIDNPARGIDADHGGNDVLQAYRVGGNRGSNRE